MKKAITIITCILLVFVLVGCGEKPVSEDTVSKEVETYTKVTLKDGTVETLDWESLDNLWSANHVAYEQKYGGCKVEVVATVSHVTGSGYTDVYGVFPVAPKIYFNEGLSVDLGLCYDDDKLAEFLPGTKVKVIGTLKERFCSIDNFEETTVTIVE